MSTLLLRPNKRQLFCVFVFERVVGNRPRASICWCQQYPPTALRQGTPAGLTASTSECGPLANRHGAVAWVRRGEGAGCAGALFLLLEQQQHA